MPDSMTAVALPQLKRDGRKIAGIVARDETMAHIADRARHRALNMAGVYLRGG
jgi:hypothetical protein